MSWGSVFLKVSASVLLFTSYAHAAKPTPKKAKAPKAGCEKILSTSEELNLVLKSKKKSMSVLVGIPNEVSQYVHGAAQANNDLKRPTFVFQLMESLATHDDVEAFATTTKKPMLERTGYIIKPDGKSTAIGITVEAWLKSIKKSQHAQLIYLFAEDLTFKQQAELLDIYYSLPANSNVHIVITGMHPENVIADLRDDAKVINATSIKTLSGIDDRSKRVRSLANEIAKPRDSLLGARIVISSRRHAEYFVSDVLTLLKDLTGVNYEFFHMEVEPLDKVPSHHRLLFSEKIGATGSTQHGFDAKVDPEEFETSTVDKQEVDDFDDESDDGKSGRSIGPSLEEWIDNLDHSPEKNDMRIVIIPTANMTKAEYEDLGKWLQAIKDSPKKNQYRVLIVEEK